MTNNYGQRADGRSWVFSLTWLSQMVKKSFEIRFVLCTNLPVIVVCTNSLLVPLLCFAHSLSAVEESWTRLWHCSYWKKQCMWSCFLSSDTCSGADWTWSEFRPNLVQICSNFSPNLVWFFLKTSFSTIIPRRKLYGEVCLNNQTVIWYRLRNYINSAIFHLMIVKVCIQLAVIIPWSCHYAVLQYKQTLLWRVLVCNSVNLFLPVPKGASVGEGAFFRERCIVEKQRIRVN